MVTKQEDETYCVDEEVSSSMILKPATTHALSDTMSISGEHWIIEAVLFATGVTKGVEGTKSQHGSASRSYVATFAIAFLVHYRSLKACHTEF